MEFLNSTGLKEIISSLKNIVDGFINEIWTKSISFSCGDGESWFVFKVSKADSVSHMKQSQQYILHTTDAQYSRWNTASLDYEYPIATAPNTSDSLSDGVLAQNYYTKNITINPYNGNIKAKSITADSYKVTGGNSSQMIMADGSLKSLSELKNTTIKCCAGADEPTFSKIPQAYYITQEEYNELMGNDSDQDLCFFQMFNSGTVFQRINRYWFDYSGSETSEDRIGRFMAYDAINNKMLVAWPTEQNGSYYIVFVNTDSPLQSYKGWWSNTVIISKNVEFS